MKDARPRSLLAFAIERRDWELAALCLLVGVTIQARRIPPGAVDEIIAELAGDDAPRRHRQRRRRHVHR